MCTACGCCFGATQCRDGVMTFAGYNDGCRQCPISGGNGGGGGNAQGGSAGSAGIGGASGTAGSPDLPALSQCDAPMPCDAVTETSGEIRIPPVDAALRCVIQALSARTPGLYVHTSSIVSGIGGGTHTSFAYLVKSDGSVQRTGESGNSVSLAQSCSLLSPTDYASCLESTATGMYTTPECEATSWTTDCVDATVSCE